MDSDSIYTTNQPDIVAHAKYCVENYPTIVNNIPQEKTTYTNDISSFSAVDNKLAAAQRAIGESSNLAQIALSYTYSFEDNRKYEDYVCILSVVAQAAIDNAKRIYDIDLMDEILRIKREMNVKENGYPAFWLAIRNKFDIRKINWNLTCPMNQVYDMKIGRERSNEKEIPMLQFFVNYELGNCKKVSKKVEELITKYSIRLGAYNISNGMHSITNEESEPDEYLLLRTDFDELIKDIREAGLSKKYTSIFAWLINRAFMITPSISKNRANIKTALNKNRALLLKTLYLVDKDALLACFAGTPNIE